MDGVRVIHSLRLRRAAVPQAVRANLSVNHYRRILFKGFVQSRKQDLTRTVVVLMLFVATGNMRVVMGSLAFGRCQAFKMNLLQNKGSLSFSVCHGRVEFRFHRVASSPRRMDLAIIVGGCFNVGAPSFPVNRRHTFQDVEFPRRVFATNRAREAIKEVDRASVRGAVSYKVGMVLTVNNGNLTQHPVLFLCDQKRVNSIGPPIRGVAKFPGRKETKDVRAAAMAINHDVAVRYSIGFHGANVNGRVQGRDVSREVQVIFLNCSLLKRRTARPWAKGGAGGREVFFRACELKLFGRHAFPVQRDTPLLVLSSGGHCSTNVSNSVYQWSNG